MDIRVQTGHGWNARSLTLTEKDLATMARQIVKEVAAREIRTALKAAPRVHRKYIAKLPKKGPCRCQPS